MKIRTKIMAVALALALTGCTSQLVNHSGASASAHATVGGAAPAPVTKADAAPGPDPHYECHDKPVPFPSGISVTTDVYPQIQGRVDIYCDTPAQIPGQQTTELTLAKIEGKKLTEIASSTVEYPPGVGPGAAWQYIVNAPTCTNGTYELDYLITGLTSDGRSIDYPVIGTEVGVTGCPTN